MSDHDAPIGTSAGALSVVPDYGAVKKPEDLPPALAREIAEIAATHDPTFAEFLRESARDLVVPVAGVGAAGALGAWLMPAIAPWTAAWVAFTFVAMLASLRLGWRSAALRLVQARLKDAGVPLRGRLAIGTRLMNVLGMRIPSPKFRPSAHEIARALAPRGPATFASEAIEPRPRAAIARDVDVPTLRVVAQARRRARITPAFDAVSLAVAAFGTWLAIRAGSPVMLFLAAPLATPFLLARTMLRAVMREPLKDAGLAGQEIDRAIGAVARVAKRHKKELRALDEDARDKRVAELAHKELRQ